MKKYIPRLIEKKIENYLNIIGAIVIEGPKWSGKSTTAERYANTIVKLQDPIVFRKYLLYSTTSKELLLQGVKPIMFDEWQKIPSLWDFIRLDVDDTGQMGSYILTGSSKPEEYSDKHTGTGRFVKIKMRTMSLWESGDSNGEVSIKEIFENKKVEIKESNLTIKDLSEIICKGGWPGVSKYSVSDAILFMRSYYETLTTEDIIDVDDVKRDPTRAKIILRAFSRQIAQITPYTTMIADIVANGQQISNETFYSYIRAFEKLYIIENIPAWTPKLRSKTIIRTTDKKHLIDPSLAAISLDAYPNDLINDINTFGFLFESLCARDLKIYADYLDGSISHYRDNSGLEVDYIFHLNNGEWAAIEIKLGDFEIDKAAKNLLLFSDKLDEMNKPSFLMIITGTGLSYQREDGIYVVPIGCLKP